MHRQAVLVLRGRTLQAWRLVCTGGYEGSPTDGGTRGRRVQGGRAPLSGFWARMRSLYGPDLPRDGGTESDSA